MHFIRYDFFFLQEQYIVKTKADVEEPIGEGEPEQKKEEPATSNETDAQLEEIKVRFCIIDFCRI
jgi:hypothetical protein